MSAIPAKRFKVSREGLSLIKSFEGFRPHAVMSEGRWVIGYGHRASAREGLTVSPADAELLLQYDLIPIAEALNTRFGARLVQHQFDALASFALSVGLDRFLASDVARRLEADEPRQAAEALLGWPEAGDQVALRRRAAERAMFNARDGRPVAVADLMTAPLTPHVAPMRVSTEAARAAAVASLLGEPGSVAATGVTAPADVATEVARALDADRARAAKVDAPPVAGSPETESSASIEAPADAADPFPADPDAEPIAQEPGQAPLPEALATPAESLTPEGQVLRHEIELAPELREPRLSQVGGYLFMGVVGLAACAGAVVARQMEAARPQSNPETGYIILLLAALGVVCLGVSIWNVWRHFTRTD